jgi:probable F420-dependent oxidoreductase
MSLGFGLLSAQTRPGETGWSRAYEETLQLARDAERLGFASVWTTEHHFVDDGYMPSLLVVSAAIAAATEKIEIGTGVVLAPLHDPLRLAEDAATVSLLSGGRFTLGLGLGWSEVEYGALGVGMNQRGAAMEEILQILPLAWSGEPFRHNGGVYQLPEVGVRPTPTERIPIVIGGSAEAAIRRAARLADGVFANASVDKFLQQMEWIKDELDMCGRDPSEFRVIHYSVLLPAETEEAAWERYSHHVWQMSWKYSDMESSAIRSGPSPAAPDLTEETRTRLRQRSTLAGPSDQIVERLLDVRKRSGLNVDFVSRSFFHTIAYAEQVEIMEQLAAEVAPHL